MPKIFGSSLLAILLATFIFYMIGFLIYGILFDEQWLSYAGMTEEQALARNAELGPLMFVWGILISLAQVLGIAAVLKKAGAVTLTKGAMIGLFLVLLIALPVMAYNWLYQGSSASLLRLDTVHLAIAYTLAGAILGFFRGRASS